MIASFAAPVMEFHERTEPSDWLEGLVKAYVGDGIAIDFYREVAALVDPRTRALVLEVFEDTGHAGFVQDRVRAAIAADPRVGGRPRCGDAGWSARRSPRRSGWWPTTTPWRTCSWATASTGRASTSPRSAGCSTG